VPLFGADLRIAGRLVEASIDHPTAAVHRLTGWALEAGVELESLAVHRASLEDVYLSLTSEAGTSEAGTSEAGTSDAEGSRSQVTAGESP
jgi:ABC-2 type transport system ATP-binding protein